jgi:hypothetical protein
MPRTRTPESYVLESTLQLFAAEKIYAMRMNSGALMVESKGGKRYPVKLHDRGTADILAIVPSKTLLFMPLWVELKAPKGKLSEDQVGFRDDVVRRGHSYLVVTETDQIMEWLKWFRSRD